jgi:hypothetical protein
MRMTLLFKVDNVSTQRNLNDRRVHEDEIKKKMDEQKKVYIQTEDKD